MRIALVCMHFHLRGGVARDAYLFARELAELGVEVHVYGNARTSLKPDHVIFHAVPTRQLFPIERLAGPTEHFLFAYRATEEIRRRRKEYDVVYVTGAEAWEQDVVRVHAVVRAENTRWPSRGGRHLRAAHARGRLALITGPQNPLERSIQRLQFREGSFRRLVAATDEVRDDLCSLFDVSPDEVDVLPCPIDVEAIAQAPRAAVRETFRLAPDDIVLLFLGNDFYRKGLDEAIRVVAQLGAHVHLVVVGAGDPDGYIALARDLGVASRVHFAGGTESPETFLKDADILFLPTREDVWGIVLVEAMAAGVPVVTSAAAGASAAVALADAGVVVDRYATRGFVDALRALTQDPARRLELGANGMAAGPDYDVRRLAPVLAAVLERSGRGR